MIAESMYSDKPTWQSCRREARVKEGQGGGGEANEGTATTHLPEVLLPLAPDGGSGVTLGLTLAPQAVLVLLVLLLNFALGREDEPLARVARPAKERQEARGRDEALVGPLTECALHAGCAEAGERDGAGEEERGLGGVEGREGGAWRSESGCAMRDMSDA